MAWLKTGTNRESRRTRRWFRGTKTGYGAAASETPRRFRGTPLLGAITTLVSSGVVVVGGAAPASAATPEYEMTGQWVDAPETISRGNPVVAEWRVNVNDADEPPSNEPVDNVTATFTLDNAFFDGIPDLCLAEGVDPVSSISDDGTELTCNFGTVNMGTAIVVQTPVVADGETGEEVVLDGTSPGGETVGLPPIPIENPFAMDMQWTGVSNIRGVWDDTSNPSYVDVDLQWSLRLGQGSDVGPDEVTYRLNVGTDDGSPVDVGVNFRDGESGCSRFDAGRADGHPWSRTNLPIEDERNTSFVDECILTEVSPGVFDLTLRGINYDLLNVPTRDSWEVDLPTNWNYIASGSLWFRVFTDNAGSLSLDANEPTYTAPTGQQFTDLASNNTSNKTYTLPGSFSARYIRGYTGNGGSPWDDSYRTSPGTTVRHRVANQFGSHNASAGDPFGNCLTFDYRHVRWDPSVPVQAWVRHDDLSWERPDPPPGQIEYYVGNDPTVTPGSGGYDPDQFDCGTGGGWTTNPPDPSQVKAVRHTYPFSTYSNEDARTIILDAFTKINDDVPVGQDVWMFGSAQGQNGWVGPDRGNQITPTDDARYPYTTGRRDILRIVTATPFIQKEAARSTVTAGVPADFTLTYSATGSGNIPDSVDGYEIVDTLPVGMSYEPGSADPEPVVSMSGGQEVLTWTLDGVETNVEHELAYQAVADPSVEPGTPLTNTAQSHLEGASSEPVDETVTTTVNGYTTILKTEDVEYIPNEAGDGVGQGSWTVEIESFDPLPQAFTDTIDILPYNGDGRGTSFSGSYTLDDVVTPDGGTVYYTDADPATLSDDPADPSNGAAGDPAGGPTGNTVGWTTEKPADPTAVRVIGGELAPGGTFSFQVVITTDGAQPQDVYVNRAQARAEHTELVMRTSAPLVVTDYIVEKTSDPAEGTIVEPGDTVEYTTTVTQLGSVPAGAALTDTLDDVLDDATYNDDVEADIGEVTFADGVISWEGEVPVGEVATITYSVTVDETDKPEEIFLKNVVSSVGCPPAIALFADVDDPDRCTTEHPGPGRYEVSKTAVPAPGTEVSDGEVVTYHVEIAQVGTGPALDASITDDLSDVFDDASWNDDLDASAGTAQLDGSTLTWTGDIDVGQTVILTYSVTVTNDQGKGRLYDIVTPGQNGSCVPAPDENPDCETEHPLAMLPTTGVSDVRTAAGIAVLLIALGAGILARNRHRRRAQHTTDQL